MDESLKFFNQKFKNEFEENFPMFEEDLFQLYLMIQ